MTQRKPSSKTWAIFVGASLLLAGLVGAANAANIFETDVLNENDRGHYYRGVSIDGSSIAASSIEHAHIQDSDIMHATIRHASIDASYLRAVLVEDAALTDTRAYAATLHRVALDDVTICQVGGDVSAGATCWLVSKDAHSMTTHARLTQDAPMMASPGESFELHVDSPASTLVVRNDPAGATGLGFDPTADDAAIESIELWKDGEWHAHGLHEEIDLPEVGDEIRLRVNVAEEGIIDGSRLGLVLELDGHGLRTEMTTLDVVATQLVFAPPEAQAFAPFIADNVARLVIMLPVDAHMNVDRDVDVALRVDVHDVHPDDGTRVLDPVDEHAYLHGDSEFFSDEPFKYSNPQSDVAHNPSTLEFLLRDFLGLDIDYGDANFHATHLVAQSPYETELTLHASTTNALGEELTASKHLVLEPTPDEEHPSPQDFGEMPPFPGTGTLRVEFVDDDGRSIKSGRDWTLFIQETPMSHQTEMRVDIGEGKTSFEQPLAASNQLGLPFGDFFPSEYKVCIQHAGGVDCWQDGEELVNIQTGETTAIRIAVG